MNFELWGSFLDFVTALAVPKGEFLTLLTVVRDVLIIVAGAGVTLFALVYRLLFNYKKYPAGHALADVTLAFAAVFGLIVLAKFVSAEWFFRYPVSIAFYAWLSFATFRLLWVLLRSWGSGGDVTLEPKPRKEEKTP